MIAWLLVALALASPGPTLDEVLAAVDAHLPLLVAAEAKVAAAEAERLAAAGIFDPTADVGAGVRRGPYDEATVDVAVSQRTPLYGLRFEAGYRLGVGKFPVYDGKKDTLDGGEVRGAVVLPLLKDGLTDAGRTELVTARAAVLAAQAEADAKRVDLRRKARQAWWSWLAAGEKLAVAERMLAVAEEAQRAVTARIERGDAAPIEGVDAERVVRERQASLAKAQRDRAAASYGLGLYLRDGQGRPAPPDSPPPGLPRVPSSGLEPVDEIEQRALAQRPELRAVEAEVAIAEARLRLAKLGVLPKLDLSFGIAQDLPAGAEDPEPLDLTAGGKLSFTFLQRPGRGKLEASRGKADAVRAELVWVRDTVSAEVRTVYATVVAAHAQAVLADQVVVLAEQLETATLRRLELGDVDRFSLYLREQSTLKARLDAVDAWTLYHRAAADLAAAVGEP